MRRSASPTPASTSPPPAKSKPPKSSRIRLKQTLNSSSTSHSEHKYHRHHHRHHRSYRPYKRTHSPSRSPPVSPTSAFRISLFDALADDEGAAYWEGVYGQPIHIYSPYYQKSKKGNHGEAGEDNGKDGADNIQRMTDDEYAEYVRRKMWERSHEYIFEERERRAEERRQRREQEREERRRRGNARVDDEGDEWWEDAWDRRRGRERRSKRRRMSEGLDIDDKSVEDLHRWGKTWQRYCQTWEDLDPPHRDRNDTLRSKHESRTLSFKSPAEPLWPTKTGLRSSVSRSTVEEFYANIRPFVPSIPQPSSSASSHNKTSTSTSAFKALLKSERIRWHPDRMYRRLRHARIKTEDATEGGEAEEVVERGDTIGPEPEKGEVKRRSGGKAAIEGDGDEEQEVIRLSTMVFQVIDQLWEASGNAGG